MVVEVRQFAQVDEYFTPLKLWVSPLDSIPIHSLFWIPVGFDISMSVKPLSDLA